MHRKRLLGGLLLALALSWAATAAFGYDFTPLEGECEGDFCVKARVAALVPGDEARVGVCLQPAGAGYHAVVQPGRARLVLATAVAERPLCDWSKLPAAAEHEVVVQRVGEALRLVVDRQLVTEAQDDSLHLGTAGMWSSAERVKVTEGRLQPLAPIHLTDDFMRAGAETGEWETLSGKWTVRGIRGEPQPPPPDQTMNPFSYEGSAGESPALSAVGYWFWSDYSVAAAVRPDQSGVVGLCACAAGPDDYLAFRWSEGLTTGTRQLVRLENGKETLLTESPGGYEPGQWYWLELRTEGNDLVAWVDGLEACRSREAGFGLGRAALLVSGKEAQATFDDVLVTSRPGTAAPLPPPRDTAVPQHYVNDEILRKWTTETWSWKLKRGSSSSWHHGRFFTPPTVRATLSADLEDNEKLWLIAGAHNTNGADGYRVEVTGGAGQSKWRLLRDGQEAGSAKGPALKKGDELTLQAEEGWRQLTLKAGDQRVLQFSDPSPLTGPLVACGSEPARLDLARTAATCVTGRDWMFSRAPVDFRQEAGLWEIEPHWACTGKAAHFSGLDEYGAPLLWSKEQFGSNLVVEAVLSNADYQVRGGETIPKNLGLTIGADGDNLGTGYSLFLGVGKPRNTLLLHGSETLLQQKSKWTKRASHNQDNWLHVRLEALEGKLTATVNGEVECEYDLPQPLPAGHLAFWGYRGGLVLGRVRLWSDQTPTVTPPSPARLAVDRLRAFNPHGTLDVADLTPCEALSMDFEQDAGTVVTTAELSSARIARDTTNPASGKGCLKIVNPGTGGNFALWLTNRPLRVKPGAKLEFDYRLPPTVKVNLYLRHDGRWREVGFATGPSPAARVGGVAGVQTDGHWRHASVPVFDLLKDPEGTPPEELVIDQAAFASADEWPLRLGFLGNPVGATWWLDNVRLIQGEH